MEILQKNYKLDIPKTNNFSTLNFFPSNMFEVKSK